MTRDMSAVITTGIGSQNNTSDGSRRCRCINEVDILGRCVCISVKGRAYNASSLSITL